MPTVGELARLVDGEVVGDPDTPIRGFAGATAAGEGDITFAVDERWARHATESGATAIVVNAPLGNCPVTQVVVPDANLAFARIVTHLARQDLLAKPGIHPAAIIEEGARVDPSAVVQAGAVVGMDARVGARTVIFPNVVIGERAVIGADCLVQPNASIMRDVVIGDRVILGPGCVIGGEGFGYATTPEGTHEKIPQVGTVLIEDDVEVGAGTCIDRARFDATRIGRGTKIDNLVQIAHNVDVGPHSIIVAQVGIAGSVKLGHHVILGGHVGIKGHVQLGDRTNVGAFSGVGSDLESGQTYIGIPAIPARQGLKVRALQARLPELYSRIKQLEKRLARMQRGEDAAAPVDGGEEA